MDPSVRVDVGAVRRWMRQESAAVGIVVSAGGCGWLDEGVLALREHFGRERTPARTFTIEKLGTSADMPSCGFLEVHPPTPPGRFDVQIGLVVLRDVRRPRPATFFDQGNVVRFAADVPGGVAAVISVREPT